MANALTSNPTNLQTNALHQFLHGYSEGHRLLQGSMTLPNDLARLMMRMSDLSGSSVVSGFEQYITGYPLDTIDAYALAMTWYASEMPRPGCVWTHTLTIPSAMLRTISSLVALKSLFKRPAPNYRKDQYAEPLFLNDSLNDSLYANAPKRSLLPSAKERIAAVFCAYYGSSSPVVLAARDSDEFADAILDLWSQQWPALRQRFAFCTGSLSGRSIGGRAFDIQCSPPTLAKDILRESASTAEPIMVSDYENMNLGELDSAINDALITNGGPFRKFLWAVADESASRADFAPCVKVYNALGTVTSAPTLVDLLARAFPDPGSGGSVKRNLLAGRAEVLTGKCAEQDILLALATTDKYSSFDVDGILNDRVAKLLTSPQSARRLVWELFRSNLNPFGDQLLTALVGSMAPGDAHDIAREHPQLLPALFHANPTLAASPHLWSAAGDRKRELLDALVAQEIHPDLVSRVVTALLDSGSDRFIRRAFEKWGGDAVYAALDWTDKHGGATSDVCRGALASHLTEVMSWVESGNKSTQALAAVARVVAPYASRIAKHDSKVWLRTLRATLQESGQEEEATYIRAFLLALAFCNAPPAPLDLIEESFEVIYRKAEKEQLRDSAWMVVEPFVPELNWFTNWDKCERMRRALLSAFMRYSWPAREINRRIKSAEIRQQILNRAYKVDAEHYFQSLS